MLWCSKHGSRYCFHQAPGPHSMYAPAGQASSSSDGALPAPLCKCGIAFPHGHEHSSDLNASAAALAIGSSIQGVGVHTLPLLSGQAMGTGLLKSRSGACCGAEGLAASNVPISPQAPTACTHLLVSQQQRRRGTSRASLQVWDCFSSWARALV